MSAAPSAASVVVPTPEKPRTLQDVADDLFDAHAMLEALAGRIELHRVEDEGGIDYDAAGLLRRVVSVVSGRLETVGAELADWKERGAA